MKHMLITMTLSCVALTAAGCAGGAAWRLERLRTVEGLMTPECVVVDPADGNVYVSNINAATAEEVDLVDGNGFISRLGPGGEALQLRWVASTPTHPIHSPKGMAVLDGYLYVADRTQVKRCRLDGAGPAEVVPLTGAEGLNDAATDGRWIYVSSTTQGRIYRLDPTGRTDPIVLQDLPRANGLTFHKGRMFAVTVVKGGGSDLYEIDPAGKAPPRPFGLSRHFVGLDAVEVLDDGTFLLTDVWGHKIFSVSPDGKHLRTLLTDLEYPADLGFDRQRGLIYIPQFFRNNAVVYKLVKGR